MYDGENYIIYDVRKDKKDKDNKSITLEFSILESRFYGQQPLQDLAPVQGGDRDDIKNGQTDINDNPRLDHHGKWHQKRDKER